MIIQSRKRYGILLVFMIAIGALLITLNPFKNTSEQQASAAPQKSITASSAIVTKVEENKPAATNQVAQKILSPESTEVIAIAKHYQEAFRANPRSIARLIKLRPAIESKHLGFVIEPSREKAHFDKLGLKLGDIVTEVNGVKVSNLMAMEEMIGEFGTTKTLALTLIRNEAPVTLRYEIN